MAAGRAPSKELKGGLNTPEGSRLGSKPKLDMPTGCLHPLKVGTLASNCHPMLHQGQGEDDIRPPPYPRLKGQWKGLLVLK